MGKIMIIHRAFDEVFRTWSNIAVIRAILDTSVGLTGNEVARTAGMDPHAAINALSRLEELGIVHRQRGGRDHIFTLNRNHYLVVKAIVPLFKIEKVFFDEVTSAIDKALGGNVVSIVLFGSVAQGNETAQSDFDICCIVKNEDQKDKVQAILNNLSSKFHKRFGIKLAPIFFMKDEFVKKAKNRNRLVNQIIESGKLITGKNPKLLIHG
ncbi:MAG: nucleotidyltransferase domain-containing protein [Bacteroidetes bacterium]|nr:nucleotidyltransferase domain-containing protein [Bacteroidota bacterium]